MQTIYFGAIDIGSNAARLLIASVNTDEPVSKIRKTILLRIPLRLGEDVFSTGRISEERIKKFIRMMKAYKHLMSIYEVEDYMICATSAMREASNGTKVAETILDRTGMKIDIISGKDEARLVYDSKIADELNPDKTYMYVDVGGGSTEISIIEGGRRSKSKSFGIGTLRLLAGKVNDSDWASMSKWLAEAYSHSSDHEIEIIGMGGNINKLYRLANLAKGEKLSPEKLRNLYIRLKNLSRDERMIKYDMRPDRADVIIPASEIFLFVCDRAKVSAINVPTIGLVDGIVHSLYEKYRKKSVKKRIIIK
ncbi:MAG: Ppx/GppA family phosphatase [Prevotellaceae bacterium]|jgi:exopolyphosphatase/guanosine-5'-triphosphate,3'-diphosphate pyrophosphatase|nr:Ppx/GppA family phosphatase [Prevotellaceae bacterium]